MIIYVFLVWFCATLFFLVLEVVSFSCLPHPQEYLTELLQAHPELGSQLGQNLGQNPWIADMLLLGGLSICLLILGYILEWKQQPVFNSYRQLQKTYPNWYRRWPAAWREIWLLLLLSCGGSLVLLTSLVWLPLHSLVYLETGWLSFCIGLSILPIWRFRILQREDRPEKPPQALIHSVVPQFPLKHSLLIGQYYLRLILPLFCLFVLLLPSLGLGYLQLQGLEYLLLFGGLGTGLGLAWLLSRESRLDPSHFRDDLFQLSGRLILTGGVLHFATQSENLIVLAVFTVFGGWVAGSY